MISAMSPGDQFRQVCGKFATGIVVATVMGEGRPHGVTVNSFTSVSLDPPLILFCLDRRAAILPHFQTAGHFAINILEEAQIEISGRFARTGLERFEGVEWRAGATGVPVLEGTLAFLECALESIAEGGDHVIVLGEVMRAGCRDGRPLLYFASGYRRLEAEE